MNDSILSTIKNRFFQIGSGSITGETALKIVCDVIDSFAIPKEVEEALQFIQDCNNDYGFCGSPQYYEKKAIVDAYYEPIRKREKLEAEKAEYERLKEKFG